MLDGVDGVVLRHVDVLGLVVQFADRYRLFNWLFYVTPLLGLVGFGLSGELGLNLRQMLHSSPFLRLWLLRFWLFGEG